MPKKSIILIGYIYNNNGMAAWCIEAARAFAEIHDNKNLRLVVAVSEDISSTMPSDLEIVSIPKMKEYGGGLWPKIRWRLYKYFFLLFKPDAAPHLGAHIMATTQIAGLQPDVVFWNQSNLLCRKWPIPQWVVGWAYPNTLSGYIQKIKIPGNSYSFNKALELLYWYRTDNWAYANAYGVLAVTRALYSQLQNTAKNALYAPPGCSQKIMAVRLPHIGPLKLCVMAVGLTDKRKNIIWMVEALATLANEGNWELHLVGEAPASFQALVKQCIPTSVFHGKLPRHDAIEILQQADLLLFGSLLDDWGFVQVEAMAGGIPIFAPHQLPSLEIIPDNRFLFQPGSKPDFTAKIKYWLHNPDELHACGNMFLNHFNQHFSSPAFAKVLDQALVLSKINNESTVTT